MNTSTVAHALFESSPSAIWHSSLFARGGSDVVTGLPDNTWLQGLAQEAAQRYPRATDNFSAADDSQQVRGGNPARQFLAVEGGPVQDAFFHHPDTVTAITGYIGARVAPSGARGTYSYYCRPGDYLALHRDIVQCDLALITMLSTTRADTPGLYAYPDELFTPLSEITSTTAGRREIPLAAGHSALVLGGLVPHGVTPLSTDEHRMVSILCFTIL